MKNRKTVFVAVGLIILLAVFGYTRLAARQANAGAAGPEGDPPPEDSGINAIIETGTVEADTLLTRITEAGGVVRAVYAATGDTIEAGQILVELDNDELMAKIAQARLSLELAQVNLAAMRSPEVRTNEVAAAELQVRRAELLLADRERALAELTLTAPISGRVSDVTQYSPGREITANELLLTVIDDSTLYLQDTINDIDLPKVRLGQTVNVYVGGNQIKFSGTVTDIGSEGRNDPIRGYAYYPVEVAVGRQTDKGTKITPQPGMYAYFTFNEYGPGERIASEGGVIAAADRAEVRAKSSGTLEEIPFRVGDRIQAGAVVAVLSNADLRSAAEQARLDLAAARQNLAVLQQPEEHLYTQAQIQAQEVTVRQAEANLAALLAEADKLRITAPVGGTVTGRVPKSGDLLPPGAEVISVVDTQNLNLRVSLDEMDIGQITVGQAIPVTIDALPDRTYTATVFEINPVAQVQGGFASFEVLLRLEDPTGIKPGMTARITVK